MSLGFAIVGGLIVSGHAFPYSIYAVSHGAKHVVVTTILLVCGAMTITWICDTITESGFEYMALIQMQDVASAVSGIQFYEKVQPNIRNVYLALIKI
ncbi:hypothetical protein RIF29_39291 [Crotalaria pallida]|uniref:Uncharacterized protein n=1 Tax=Crotalaria pallida TaxID=3830 RepID=A0AAN9HPH5_CROPI